MINQSICITCTFLESSTTDCVAVVHQRISQLNSSGLMNIESSHKFTRSGDTASGCIEGVNLIDFKVGVIGVTVYSSIHIHNPGFHYHLNNHQLILITYPYAGSRASCIIRCITLSGTFLVYKLNIIVMIMITQCHGMSSNWSCSFHVHTHWAVHHNAGPDY